MVISERDHGGVKCNTWSTTPLYFLGVPPKAVNLTLCFFSSSFFFPLTPQVDSILDVKPLAEQKKIKL